MPQVSLHSPVGDISISEHDSHIVAVDWGWGRDQEKTPLLREAVKQLNAYFDGKLMAFDLPLLAQGTAFQKRVWAEMLKIPKGQVRSYGQLAARLDSGAQAVGTACGKNPIPIIIPCHRVVGTGNLGGYSGGDGWATPDDGLATKVALLRLENADIVGKSLFD